MILLYFLIKKDKPMNQVAFQKRYKFLSKVYMFDIYLSRIYKGRGNFSRSRWVASKWLTSLEWRQNLMKGDNLDINAEKET